MKFSKASSYQASEMPRYSNTLLLQRDLYHLFLASSTRATSSNEADDALEYLILSEGLKDQRYLFSRSSILKSNWAVRVLPTLSDDRYRGYLRMSRISVQRIIDFNSIRFGLPKKIPIFNRHRSKVNFNVPYTSLVMMVAEAGFFQLPPFGEYPRDTFSIVPSEWWRPYVG